MAGPPSRLAGHHQVIERFGLWKGMVAPGFAVNFLGVKTRTCFYPPGLFSHPQEQFVTSEPPPIDEEYFEWITVLESVAAARDRFTMLELGAGWGRWMVIAAAALRASGGLPYRFIGVEAEPTHFRWLRQHLQDNNVDLGNCHLIQAAIADRDGSVLFQTGRPSEWYGQAIVVHPVGWRQRLRQWVGRAEAQRPPEGVRKVRAVSLTMLLRPLDVVDLVDLDIQGAELTVLRPAAEQLARKAKRVLVGTHSPDIEAGLRALFRELAWENLCDYPGNGVSQTPWGTIRFQDGVQSWINPRL